MKTRGIYLGLGSNTGDRYVNLHKAVNEIDKIPGVKVIKQSSVYETEPWGKIDQGKFLNQVIEIEADMSPGELLKTVLDIEIKMGRQREERWGPRNIDIDILLYGNELVDSPELKVPHPYMQQRLFVLVPLGEINADIVFPDTGAKIGEVLVRVLEREGNNGIKRI